jgi:hypothetical protein
MPYSEYTNLAKLKKKLGIEHQAKNWVKTENIEPIAPSELLKMEIDLGLRLPLNTEKARSENLISPVLKEVLRRNEDLISYFSGYGFNVDESLGLNGNCDYLLAARPHLLDVENPVFCLVEAKNGVVDEAYAQCAAEMYAASLYNKQFDDTSATKIIYGCATNGYEWVFLMLQKQVVLIDNQSISIKDLPVLLGIFQFIIKQI